MNAYGLKLTSALLVLALATPALAQDKKPAEPTATKGSDKMDLKKLEDKYWSSKDDDYNVIQNRTFSKTGKFYGSLEYGTLMNDPFAKAKSVGVLAGYYLTEDFGIELSYYNYNSGQNDTVSEYRKIPAAAGVSPNFNLIKSSKTLSMTYTPFYAKMAFMNKAILYFDMGFTLGAGVTDYEQQIVSDDGTGTFKPSNTMASAPHFEIGVMQQMFLNQHFAFRLDIKNSFYSQKLKQYQIGIGAPESSRTESSKSANDTTISVGLTVFTK